MRASKAILTAALAIFSSLAVALWTAGQLFTSTHFTLVGLLAISLALLSIMLRKLVGEDMLGKTRRRPAGAMPSATELIFPANDLHEFADKAIRVFAGRFNDSLMVDRLRETLMNISALTTRITEKVVLERKTFYFKTSRTALREPNTEVLIPIYRLEKQSLLDELTVTVDGVGAATLSYIEGQGALLTVLSILYDEIFGPVDPVRESRIFRSLMLIASDPYPRGESRAQELGRQLLAYAQQSGVPATDKALLSLRQLAEIAANYYYIFAIVPPANRRRVKVTAEFRIRDRAPTDSRSKIGSEIWREQLRLALGLETRSFFLPLPLASETPSYHLNTHAPEGMYAFNSLIQPVLVKKTDSVGSMESDPADMPTAKLSDLVGLDYIHLYARDLNGNIDHLVNENERVTSDVILGLRIEFRERPPGLMLQIALCSLFVLGISIAVGHFHDSIFGPGASSTGTSSASLIFGLPVILAGWLVVRLSPEAVKKISLPTAFMAAWLIANSLAISLLAGFKGIQRHTTMMNLGVLSVRHIAWATVLVSSGAHMALCIFFLWARIGRYLRRLKFGQKALTNQGRMS